MQKLRGLVIDFIGVFLVNNFLRFEMTEINLLGNSFCDLLFKQQNINAERKFDTLNCYYLLIYSTLLIKDISMNSFKSSKVIC